MVTAKYSWKPLISIPLDNEKTAYGNIELDKISFLYDMNDYKTLVVATEYEIPKSMEAIGQPLIEHKNCSDLLIVLTDGL